MRHAVSALLADLHVHGLDAAVLAARIAELLGASVLLYRPRSSFVEAFVASAGGDFPRAQPLIDASVGLLEQLSLRSAPPTNRWRKATILLPGRAGSASSQKGYVAIGVPTACDAGIAIVVGRKTVISSAEVDVIGELSFHASVRSIRSQAMPVEVDTPRITVLPSLRIVDGKVTSVCDRMRRLVAGLDSDLDVAEARIRAIAQAHEGTSLAREILVGRDGRRLALVFVASDAYRHARALRSEKRRETLVFGYLPDDRISLPTEMLLAIHPITRQQAHVAEELLNGATVEEAANAMSLSGNTVRSHIAGLFANLGVRSRSELARALVAETFLLRSLVESGFELRLPRRVNWRSEHRRLARASARLSRSARASEHSSGREAPRNGE